jgi:hypothetical protein
VATASRPGSEPVRSAVARAILVAMLTFAIEEPPARRSALWGRASAELLVDDPPADLIVLDPARHRRIIPPAPQ